MTDKPWTDERIIKALAAAYALRDHEFLRQAADRLDRLAPKRENHIRDAGEMVEASHTVTQSHMAGLFFQAALSVRKDTTLSEDERDAIAAALAPLWRVSPTADDIAWAEDSARELFGSDGSKRPPIAGEIEQ